jgi:hypothetical protein
MAQAVFCMSVSTLGLGGGISLGVGLRQATTIAAPDITGINEFNGIGIIFYSPSNEQVANLTSGRGQGEKLEVSLNFKKYGNLKSFDIKMLRNSEIPFFNGMKVRIYYKNLPFAYGYVDTIPETDQDESVIEVSGSGYVAKLKDKKISVSYTNRSISYILEDLGTTYFLDLGFNYNSNKISTPNTSISSVDWSEKGILTIIEDLIMICNTEFETIEYIYGIDQYGDFYFKGISENEVAGAYFEGFNYQNPEVENDAGDLVNRVQLYRTQSGSDKQTEYVNTYSDTESIDKYGLYERKVTFSDFIDNTTAQNAANGIIANLKDPKIRLEIKDLEIDAILNYGYYSMNNKKQDQQTVISEFALASEWTSSLTTSSISIVDTNVFTGRLCYKWDINNSVDDYITKSVEYYCPTKLKIFVRQDTIGEYLSISVGGTQRTLTKDLVTDSGDQLVTDTGEPLVAFVSDSSILSSKDIDIKFANDWTEIELDLTGWVKITSVTITVIDSSDVTIYLDRLEIYTNSYIQRLLSLEDANYEMNSESIKCDSATFGTEKILLTEKLKKIDKKNKVAVEIFSKQ